MFDEGGIGMRLEVVDAYQGYPMGEGEAFGEAGSDEEGANESRALGHSYGLNGIHRYLSFLKGLSHRRPNSHIMST
jgi:hypothetical protein